MTWAKFKLQSSDSVTQAFCAALFARVLVAVHGFPKDTILESLGNWAKILKNLGGGAQFPQIMNSVRTMLTEGRGDSSFRGLQQELQVPIYVEAFATFA